MCWVVCSVVFCADIASSEFDYYYYYNVKLALYRVCMMCVCLCVCLCVFYSIFVCGIWCLPPNLIVGVAMTIGMPLSWQVTHLYSTTLYSNTIDHSEGNDTSIGPSAVILITITVKVLESRCNCLNSLILTHTLTHLFVWNQALVENDFLYLHCIHCTYSIFRYTLSVYIVLSWLLSVNTDYPLIGWVIVIGRNCMWWPFWENIYLKPFLSMYTWTCVHVYLFWLISVDFLPLRIMYMCIVTSE